MNRFEKVDMMEERLLEALGADGLLEALVRALSYDTKEEMFEYIAGVYDVEMEQGDAA